MSAPLPAPVWPSSPEELLKEMVVGPGPRWSRFVGAASPTQINEVFQYAAMEGLLWAFDPLLAAGADPRALNSCALGLAAGNGWIEAVVRLLPLSDPAANRSWALQQACLGGHEAVVEALWAVSCVEDAFRAALDASDWPVVDRLAMGLSPAFQDQALHRAHQESEGAAALLPRVCAHRASSRIAATVPAVPPRQRPRV